MRKNPWSGLAIGILLIAGLLVGCAKESDDDEDIVGTWTGTNQISTGVGDPNETVDVAMTFADTAYAILLYILGTSTLREGSQRGTYTYSNEALVLSISSYFNGSAWVAYSGSESLTVEIDGDSMTMPVDTNGDGIIDNTWTLTRQ
jgi:hypothetical protein